MNTSSDLTWCYQVLELPTDATEQEIKMAYRKLARQYHPDLNPGDRNAEARFKRISLAYQTLLTALKQLPQTANTKTAPTEPATPSASTSGRIRFHVTHPEQNKASDSNLSSHEKWLKVSSLNKIDSLLKHGKWQQAIDLAEKLATRFPEDPNVRQWQTSTYHRCARKLIEYKQYEQARIYLKKALQTDPHNRQLWVAIDRDYKRMERGLNLYKLST